MLRSHGEPCDNTRMPERPWDNENLREMDQRFPSGRWAGYWMQLGRRGTMQLHLTFAGGRLFGDGRDAIGDFVLSGAYHCTDGRVSMHKAYLGHHGVEYDGVAGEGGIRGVWTIVEPGTDGVDASGPFHIWPVAPGAGVQRTLHAEEPAPA